MANIYYIYIDMCNFKNYLHTADDTSWFWFLENKNQSR